MSDTSPAYIGRYPCGCITAALVLDNGVPEGMRQKDAARFAGDVIKRGMTLEHTTVAKAKADPHFMPAECPHDPKGWEREPPPDPDAYKVTTKRIDTRGLSVVYLKHRYHPHWRAGEVGRRAGAWYSTPGWLDVREAVARDGKAPPGPAVLHGPFAKRQEAIDAITKPAFERLMTETRRRRDEREKNPPTRTGPVPTHTSSGEPVPPFKPGETWGRKGEAQYIILDEPEVDERFGGVHVRVKDLRRDGEPENLLAPSWSYVHESCFPSMIRIDP